MCVAALLNTTIERRAFVSSFDEIINCILYSKQFSYARQTQAQRIRINKRRNSSFQTNMRRAVIAQKLMRNFIKWRIGFQLKCDRIIVYESTQWVIFFGKDIFWITIVEVTHFLHVKQAQ